MTVRLLVELRCEGTARWPGMTGADRCTTAITEPVLAVVAAPVTVARRQVARKGWSTFGPAGQLRDLCPTCTAKGKR